MHAIAAEIPFQFRSKFIARKELAKIIIYSHILRKQINKVKDNSYNNNLKSYQEKIYEEDYNILKHLSIIQKNNIVTKINIDTTFNKEIGNKANKNKETIKTITLEKMKNCNNNGPTIFTDGSLKGNQAAIGINLEDRKHNI